MEDAARDGPCAHGKEFSNHLIQLLSASLLSFSQVKPKRRACARGSNRTPCSHSRSAHVRSRRARAVRAKCSRLCSSALEQKIVDADARCSICIKRCCSGLRITGNARMLSSIISVCAMPDQTVNTAVDYGNCSAAQALYDETRAPPHLDGRCASRISSKFPAPEMRAH